MTTEVDIRHRLGDFELDARFAGRGRLTALFGRSGAGKSTLVNIIAGLIRPDHGRVVVDGETLVDTEKGIFVPKHKRKLGYVFQEGRLFPHLSVRQNLLYGQWFTQPDRRYEDFERVVDLLGVRALLDRRPFSLSGGEKQRVAIGRALLASPRLLLMDEPLASLDEARKQEILPFIERLRDVTRIPIVYVSHSIPEVVRLASSIVVLSDGKVAAAGELTDIMSRIDLFPLTGRYEAGAVLDTRIADHDPAFELTALRCAAGELKIPQIEAPIGTPVRVRIRARDVMIAIKRPEGLSALNVLPCRIAELGPADGPIVEIRLDLGGAFLLARVTRKTVHDLALAPAAPVFAVIKSIAFDHRSLGLQAAPAEE